MLPARQQVPPPPPITLAKLLVVEGDTPMHFFEGLLRHLRLADRIEIRNFRGVGDLRAFIMDLASSAEFQHLVTSVGVVRDAENDAGSARQSVQDALAAAGLTPHRVPPISTSIFILPDNQRPGMIETLCMEAVGADGFGRRLRMCARVLRLLAPAERSLAYRYQIRQHHAQAYLASRPQVQLFPGLAGYHGYWPWDSPVFDPVRQFLRSL